MLMRALMFPVAATLLLAGLVDALEIYRIGGENVARPDTVAGVNFHQLSWSDFTEREGLDEVLLSRGIVRPIFVETGGEIARASVARGGGPYVRVSGVASYSITEASKTMLDGDISTFYLWVKGTSQEKFGATRTVENRRVTMDLGGRFFVNRVRLIAAESGLYPDGLEVFVNDEVQTRDTVSGYGAAVSTGRRVVNLPENVRDTIDVSFPTTLAISIDLILLRISQKDVKVGEVEIFAEGFVNQASYVGPFIDLGEEAIWGQLRWRGKEDAKVKVHIQSRAGRDKDPNVYWRLTGRGNEISPIGANGKPLDKIGFALLKPGEAAGTTYDTENWSFWTAPYDFADSSGTAVLSPAPSSVFQLKVDFLPTLKGGGEVEFIEFSATVPPLAEQVVGEISPSEVALGATRQFTYAIRPTIRAKHSGFDQVEISVPFGVVSVDTVRLFGAPVDFNVRFLRPDSTLFAIVLPQRLHTKDSGGVIELVFTAPVLRYGTTFDGWVRDTRRPQELAQRIVPGDAAIELQGETLTVRTSLSSRLLTDLQVGSVFTPNGDGVNESADFSFSLLQLTSEAPLVIQLFDLAGHLRRVLHESETESGRFRFSWDGLDDEGERVPPGIYIYSITVKADGRDFERSGTVAVVY